VRHSWPTDMLVEVNAVEAELGLHDAALAALRREGEK
jgi:hypothetical protein